MIVLSFDQSHATLIVRGVQRIATFDPLDDSWSYSDGWRITDLVGQIVAIAGLTELVEDDPHQQSRNEPTWIPGTIVGSARVEAIVPVRSAGHSGPGPYFQRSRTGSDLILRRSHRRGDFVLHTDQLPFADFTPGRIGVIFEDAKPCEERCPAGCKGGWRNHAKVPDGDGRAPCFICDGKGTCAPVPYESDGPISEVTL